MAENEESAPMLAGSGQGFGLVCVPCNSMGKCVQAEGYCVDCHEHFCANCVSYHRTQSALMHHKLADKDTMPLNQTGPFVKDACTERCKVHRNKIVEYFCPNHEALGCRVCMALKHKRCTDVAYIPEISAGLEQNQEYKIFRQRLDELIRKSNTMIESAKQKLQKSAHLFSKVQQDMSAFRQEINIALDQLENDLKARCEQVNAQNIVTMETVSSKVNWTLEELQAISSDYQELLSNKQYCQAFTKLKTTNLMPQQDELKGMVSNSISDYTFVPGEILNQILKGKDILGKLYVWNQDEPRTDYMTDVSVRTKCNAETCKITGIALLPDDRLVITDWGNGTVKVIDINYDSVTSERTLAKSPWTVTRMDKNKVAITVPSARKILFMRCDDSLTINTEVRVNGECHGIAYYQDKLVVTFENPSKMEILSMAGEALQKFENDDQGNKLFINPKYVSVHTDGSSVFVSDCGNHSLIKCSMEGKILAVYRDNTLSGPSQCAVGDTGLVYLCGGSSHTIHLLTTACTYIEIVLTKRDGLEHPCSICYCKDTKTLYMGMYWNDKIKVFKWNG